MKRIIILLAIALIGCDNLKPKSASSLSKHYYNDIDIFNMKGIGEQNEHNLTYPIVEIDSISDSQRNITFWHSKDIKNQSRYFKKNNYWLAIDNNKGDTSNLTTYNYIRDNEIIELGYTSDSNYKLISIYSLSSFQNNIKTSYIFEEPIKVEPNLDYRQFLNNKISDKIIEKYVIKDGKLKVIKQRIDGLNEHTIKSDSSLYNIGRHSIFWWFYFK